jgi:hypothetical protein
LFINDTQWYSFQTNTKPSSWLLLPIDSNEKEKRNTQKRNGIDEEKKILNRETFAKNPTT